MTIINGAEISNKEVKKYEGLLVKMTKQYVEKVGMPWGDVQSMAYEGLAIAFRTYDENKSNMSFLQYAAYAIRNNILTCVNDELRTVKLSDYAQKKAEEAGESLFNTVSIDKTWQDDDSDRPNNIYNKVLTKAGFDNGDVFEYMYSRLAEKFDERTLKMFYMMFGLNGEEETQGKDIAKAFNVSPALVTIKTKAVISFIRKDNDLCEMLASLLEQ